MPTKTIDLDEADLELGDLLSLVEAGMEIIFTQSCKPIARLIHIGQPASGRVAGLHRGAIWTSDDFDAPLSVESWVDGL